MAFLQQAKLSDRSFKKSEHPKKHTALRYARKQQICVKKKKMRKLNPFFSIKVKKIARCLHTYNARSALRSKLISGANYLKGNILRRNFVSIQKKIGRINRRRKKYLCKRSFIRRVSNRRINVFFIKRLKRAVFKLYRKKTRPETKEAKKKLRPDNFFIRQLRLFSIRWCRQKKFIAPYSVTKQNRKLSMKRIKRVIIKRARLRRLFFTRIRKQRMRNFGINKTNKQRKNKKIGQFILEQIRRASPDYKFVCAKQRIVNHRFLLKA